METVAEIQSVAETLKERGERYGEFINHATICQGLKNGILTQPGYHRLKPDAKQALDVICDKVARMLNGDPEYDDNWRDIAGYATLVLNRIIKDKGSADDPVGGIYAASLGSSLYEERISINAYLSLARADQVRYTYDISNDDYVLNEKLAKPDTEPANFTDYDAPVLETDGPKENPLKIPD